MNVMLTKKNRYKIFILLVSGLLFLSNVGNGYEMESSTSSHNGFIYEGPKLDFKFIYQVIENLSNIVKMYPKGREFGTPGEHYARDLIVGWMEEIGLENVHIEKISSSWTKEDTWQNLHNFILDPDYYPDGWIGELDLKKNYTRWYLHIKVYDKKGKLVDEKFFSEKECFPLLREDRWGYHNVTLYDLTVVDDFKIGIHNQIILMENNWKDPYNWWLSNLTTLLRPTVKAFIVTDCFNETLFMLPSGTSSPMIHRFSKPGFSINGSSGMWLKRYLKLGYIVKADICSEWTWKHVDSWNVIGEIPGRSKKIAMICVLYDGWWSQATADDAVGVGLMLGIAKYIKDHNLIPWLTLKFIAWGGHEWYFRGGKSYIKTHDIKIYGRPSSLNSLEDEDILYVITPGNFGFNNTNDMYFNVGNKYDTSLMKFMHQVAMELKYTERTGIDINGDYSVYGQDTYVFFHGHKYPERYCLHAIEFDRWPFPGYHRDDRHDHTHGDVLSAINDSLFKVDCEVMAEIILRLSLPKFEVKIVSPEENHFYCMNKKIFSISRDTVLIGPTDIVANIVSENNISSVEFYVDGILKSVDTSPPYLYKWKNMPPGQHIIRVAAYDVNGNYADNEIVVWSI